MLTLRLLAIPLALFLDQIWVNLPNRFHPVAWMGSLIAALQRNATTDGKLVPLFYGGLTTAIGITFMAAIGFYTQRFLNFFPLFINLLLNALLLSLMFSISRLASAGDQIHAALTNDDLGQARHLLSWHLVSRPTEDLDAAEVAAATIESISENSSDSFVAPLFYYLILGLPGVLVYRYANTADAMLGYLTPEKEWLGKIPARFDDLLNLVPARLTALLIFISTLVTPTTTAGAISTWWADRYNTASPNAGHPMSAAAGALGVTLTKRGHYTLNGKGKPPLPDDIRMAIKLMYTGVWIIVLIDLIVFILEILL